MDWETTRTTKDSARYRAGHEFMTAQSCTNIDERIVKSVNNKYKIFFSINKHLLDD